MRGAFFIISIFVSLAPTQLLASCVDLFALPVKTEQLSFKDNVETLVSAEMEDLSVAKMQKVILNVAVDKFNYAKFSPPLVRQIVMTAAHHTEAFIVKAVASLPFDNEIRRRKGGRPMTIKEYTGTDLKLSDYGVSLEPPSNDYLASLEGVALNDASLEASDRAGIQYFAEVRANDFYLELGFVEVVNLNIMEAEDISTLLIMESASGLVRDEAVYWMFRSFLREKYIRNYVEKLTAGKRINWPQRIETQNSLIFLISAYPDLLAITEWLPMISFPNPVKFHEHQNLMKSSDSHLKSDNSIVGHLWISKAIGAPDGHHQESSRWGITIAGVNQRKTLKILNQAWDDFSLTHKMDPTVLKVEQSENTFSVQITQTEDSLRLLTEFYLSITNPKITDSAGTQNAFH